ncbi:hypothetical protein ACKLNQ_12415 [Myroides odoratimimus]|uniref:hypothetical protein n=1 Tax=Myroides odoratimimus TaxID=76832 RepID=UPI0038D4D1FE
MLDKIKKEGAENLAKYLAYEKKKDGLINKVIGSKCNISVGEVSKVLNCARDGVKAKTFYNIYKAFGNGLSFETFVFAIYPSLQNYDEKKAKILTENKKRNPFGLFMFQFEEVENTLDIIASKTSITEVRLKQLYFGQGSVEAFELLLIENALEMKMGELFLKYFQEACKS